MTKSQEYQIAFYKWEVNKMDKIIEELTFENMKLRGELHFRSLKQHTKNDPFVLVRSFNLNSKRKNTNRN